MSWILGLSRIISLAVLFMHLDFYQVPWIGKILTALVVLWWAISYTIQGGV